MPRINENRDGGDLAYTDPLTGLGNNRRFVTKIKRLIADRADDPAPFAIGIIDLDGFKPINDLFGRASGDEILMQVALRLHAAMDRHSTITRIGADKISISMRACSDTAASLKVIGNRKANSSAPIRVMVE